MPDIIDELKQNMEKYSEYPRAFRDIPYMDFMPPNDLNQTFDNMITAKVQRNQLIHDSAERNQVDSNEIDDFLRENYADESSVEYLVDGAILTCTNSTSQGVWIQDSNEYLVNPYYEYTVPENAMLEEVQIPSREVPKVLGRLSVTENPSAENNGSKYATIYDSKKEYNIPFFGNCKRLPDSEWEKAKFYKACEKGDAGFRSEGTCKYLMRLEPAWENYDIGTDYLQFIDDELGECSGITMTSMLFCRHGGFIYPITSGQKIQLLDQEEQELTDEKGLEEEDPHIKYRDKLEVVFAEYDVTDADIDAVVDVWLFFSDKKELSDYAVCGILGNVFVESDKRFDTNATYLGHYGLFQWGGGRLTDFDNRVKEWASETGLPEDEIRSSVHYQCEYAWEEYQTKSSGWTKHYMQRDDGTTFFSKKDFFETSSNPEDATLSWGISYEVAYAKYEKKDINDDGENETIYTRLQGHDNRIGMAEKLYEVFYGQE